MEGYVGWVAETLQDSGRFDVTVITTGTGRRARQESYRGIPVHRLGTWVTLSNTPVNPLWWGQVRRLLERLDDRRRECPRARPGAGRRRRVHVVGARGDDLPLRLRWSRAATRSTYCCGPTSATSSRGSSTAAPTSSRCPRCRWPTRPAAPAWSRRAWTPTCSPRRPASTPTGAPRPLRRTGGAHLALEGPAGAGRPPCRDCARRVPDVRLDIVGDGDDVHATPCPGRVARRRRHHRLARARAAPRPAALLPAHRRHGAAVADRVGVVRHDAGRGDGQWLPGGRLGRGRHPLRGPRRRRRRPGAHPGTRRPSPMRWPRSSPTRSARPSSGQLGASPRGRAGTGRTRGRTPSGVLEDVALAGVGGGVR